MKPQLLQLYVVKDITKSDDKALLLDHFEYSSIEEAKKKRRVKNDNTLFSKLQTEYNEYARKLNIKWKKDYEEKIKKYNKTLYDKENKEREKAILNLPLNEPTKRSREERILSKASNLINSSKKETTKERQKFHRHALGNTFEDVEYNNDIDDGDLFNLIYDAVLSKMSQNNKDKNLNVNIAIKFIMFMNSKNEEIPLHYNSINVERVVSPNQIKQWILEEIDRLHNAIEEYTRNSDLVFIKYELLNVQFSLTKKIRGGSYIELPEKIKLSRACVNIKNNDNKCLIWSLLAYKYNDKITHNKKNEVGTYRKYEKDIKLPDNMT